MRCSGCGAELHLGPDRCPLCGAEASFTGASKREQVSVEDYQSKVRELRKQLRHLRDDGAEAV